MLRKYITVIMFFFLLVYKLFFFKQGNGVETIAKAKGNGIFICVGLRICMKRLLKQSLIKTVQTI